MCGGGRRVELDGVRIVIRSSLPKRGFTIIEMVIVIAVIAILAMMMAPSFFDRTVRVQVQDGMALAAVAKNNVMAYYALKGELPADNSEAGAPPKEKIVGNYVTGVEIINGMVTITFGNNVNASIRGKRLSFRPAIVKDAPTVPIAWLCNNAAVPNGMTASAANQTDIPAKWLPLECR